MRYFAEMAYNGAAYHGWQEQPHSASVQETVAGKMALILGRPVEITGCGRTDAGVHASQYFFHFDHEGDFPAHFLSRLNRILPADIAIYRFIPVADEAHARFDAINRAYYYYITLRKDPFKQQTSYYYPFADKIDLGAMQSAASLLLNYEFFYPFCKSDTDVKTMRCDLRQAEWILEEEKHLLRFHIASDRFLRGMVRLIVGMCLSVGTGQYGLDAVQEALENQTRLGKSLSVPPEGLFLSEVRYAFI